MAEEKITLENVESVVNSGRTVTEEIAKADLKFIHEIGLQEHLSPTRANGLANMVKRIKMLALTALTK